MAEAPKTDTTMRQAGKALKMYRAALAAAPTPEDRAYLAMLALGVLSETPPSDWAARLMRTAQDECFTQAFPGQRPAA